jgi:Tol biopolymer transport system component
VLRFVSGLASLTGLFLSVAASVGGAGRVPRGRIAFEAEVAGLPQIFIIGADGRGLRQLTRLPFGAEHPSWSPDGKTLAFVRGGERSDLVYRISADGSGLRRLSPSCSDGCLGDGFPVYSHDGAKIAFERETVAGIASPIRIAIFTIKADGSDPVQVTPPRRRSEDHEPQWLPGDKIAFSRILTLGPSAGAGALFEVNADGAHARELTPFSHDYPNDAKWSPDGTEILFDRGGEVSAGPVNVLTMRADGTDRRQVTHFKGTETKAFVGSWSPDGGWIVWHRSGRGRSNQLFITDAAGGRRRQLTFLPAGAKPQSPAWGAA